MQTLNPVKVAHRYTFEAFRDGKLLWREVIDNLVVTEGLNDILSKYYKGSAYTAAHYLGLKGSGTIAAGDTMSSHAGWSEITSYDEAARQTMSFGTVSAGSVSATQVTFTISATVTIGGGFLTTNSTKGGTTGTLVGATDFSAARSLVDNDVLNVTVTATAAAA